LILFWFSLLTLVLEITLLAECPLDRGKITLGELKYGIANSVKKEANRTKLGYFLYQFECLPFDAEATSCYGDIRVQLESRGTPIGPLDTLIVAHALSLAATMVTNNVREFERVEGLAIENWIN